MDERRDARRLDGWITKLCSLCADQDYCSTAEGNFQIITGKDCSAVDSSCSKAIRFYIKDYNVEVHMVAGEVMVVPVAGKIPAMVDDLTIHSVGLYRIVQTGIGIMVMWDRRTSIFVKVDSKYKGTLCGLCGNYNGRDSDDLTAADGSTAASVLAFGNSWRIKESCAAMTEAVEPCQQNPHRHAWALRQCHVLAGDVFSSCHDHVDHAPFLEACIRDSCACDGGDCECFCTAVAAYAQVCNEAGVCIRWRTPDRCPVFCDFYNEESECTWHYNPCSSLPSTCSHLQKLNQGSLPPIEGCYPHCPPDAPYLDENTMHCVPKANCSCFVEDDVILAGQQIHIAKTCQICTCDNAELLCEIPDGCCYHEQLYELGAFISRELDPDQYCATTKTCSQLGEVEDSVECGITPIDVNNATTTATAVPPLPTEPPIVGSSTAVPDVAPTQPPKGRSTTVGAPVEGATVQQPTATTNLSQVPCSGSWSEWYNEHSPDADNDGDEESYQKVTASGKVVCAPGFLVENIDCRADKYPNTPWEELGQAITCNKDVGLKCSHTDQTMPFCYNYKVRFCCSLISPATTAPLSTAPTSPVPDEEIIIPPVEATRPPGPTTKNVTPKPPGEEKPTKPAPEESGAPPQEPTAPKDKTPPPPTSGSKEPEPSPSGGPVTPKSPVEEKPTKPAPEESGAPPQEPTAPKDKTPPPPTSGNKEPEPSPSGGPETPKSPVEETPTKPSPEESGAPPQEPTAPKDKTPPTSGSKEPEPSPSGGPVTPKSPVEEKPTKPAPEESGAPPQEPTAPKDKTPPPPTSGNKEPEPSPSGGPEEKPTKPSPEESGAPPQEPTAPKDKTPPPPTSGNKEQEPSPSGGPEEKPTKPSPEESGAPPQEPTAPKDKTPPPPTSGNKEPEPSPSGGPVTPKSPVEEKPTKPAPEESGAPPQEPTAPKDKTPPPPTSGNKEPEPSPSGGPETPKSPVEEKPTKPAPAESGAPPQEPTGPKDKTPPPPTSGNKEPEPSPSGGPVTPKSPVEEKPTKPALEESGAPPQEPTAPKDKTPPPPTSGNKEPEPSPSGGPEEKPTKPSPEESGAPPQEPTAPKDKTPPPPTSGNKEPEPSPSGGPVTPKPPGEEKPTKPAPEESGAPPQEPTGPKDKTPPPPTSSGKEPEPSPPTPGPEDCAPGWSDWYDEQYPDEENGGDEESYQKVIASGKVVCLPDSPVQNIECKAERFPNTPWQELGQTITCDKNKGLKCVNEDQGGLPCYNYKVRFCCSRASGPPAPSPSSRSPEPTALKDKTPAPPTSGNKEPEPSPSGGPVTPKPPGEEKPTKPAPEESGAPPQEPTGPEDKTPPPPTSSSNEPEPSPPTSGPEDCAPGWSDWYDEQYPDEENGGDEESYQKVIASGKVVCLPDSPVQNIECKAERFPNTPWQELGQTITCDKNKGLKCVNEDQGGLPCYNYKVRFCCSRASGPPAPSPSSRSPEPTASKDKTPAPPTSSNKEPEPLPPSPGPVTPKPPVEEKPTKPSPEESGAPPQEPTGSKDKTPAPPTSGNKEPEPSPSGGPVTPKPPVEEKPTKPAPAESGAPPQEPTGPKDKTPPPPTSGNKEPEPSPSGGPVTPKPPGEEKPTKPAPEESGAPPQEPTGPEDKTPPPPTSSSNEPEPSPPTSGPEDCAPGWSDWYDEQYPDEENGGDEESYQKVIASGKVVCLPDSPVQNIECKAERFPNTPWQELGQTITCDKNKGLKCVNEDQGGLPCYNYKVRFCCSRASGPPAPSPSSRSPEPTASKDKTPAPPTSSNKEPEPLPPSPGPVTPKPPVEEKPTKPSPEESGAPPQEPTGSKDKTPAPPTSGNKEPEPSPSGGPVTPKPPVEEKPTKPAPAESGAPPQEPTGPKDKTPPPPTSGNKEPEPSPSGGPVTPKPPGEEKPTKPAPEESGAPPQEPTGPKDKTPPPPTSSGKEPEPSPPTPGPEDCAPGWSDWYDEQYPDEENGGDEESYQKVIASGKVVCLPDSPVQNIECKAERFPNTPWQELGQTITCDKNKGLKCVNEDQGGLSCYNYKVRFCCSRASGPPAPSPSSRSPGPTASKDKTPAPPTSSNKEPEPLPPSPGPVTPKPRVEEKPTKPSPEESGAPPQEPTGSKDKTPAPPTSGNKEPEPSPSGGPVTPKPPVEEKPTKPAPAESGAPPQEPTGPKDKTPPPPTSGNKEPEPSPSGGPVTPKPPGEEKPTKPAPEESGAPPQEPTGPKDKTPPPPTSSGKEPEPSPPTPGPEDCAPGWSDWYDEQYPDEENGGDEESYQKVIASGKVVCLPDSPVQNIECKAERFPNTPWQELGQTITCDKNKGLKCVNEDQGGLQCYNYKVRFCCSRASGTPAPSPSSRSPEPTASKDKTPAPPTSGNKEPEPSPPSPGPVTPKPPVEEKPTKPAPEESGAPHQEPTRSKDKTPAPPTSGNKEPEPSPSGGPVTPKPPVEEKPTKPAPAESGGPPQEPTGPKDKTPPPPTSGNKEPEPSPSGGPVTPKPPGEEKPTKPAPEESGAPPQEPTGPKDKTPPPPTSSSNEPEPSPPTSGPEDCAPGWSDWYDEQYPDEENGGDEESYQKVIASGKVVCLPDSPVQNIECKAERFPNTPWQELGQTITCDKNKGLKCVNEDQGGLQCYNYKVRFCCSRASGTPAPSPSSRSPEPTASKDKTPAPPTSGNKEPEPSPSGGPVTPKPPGEEKPTKPAPEESGAPPQEPTGPKDKTPPPPTSSGKEPEPSPPTPGPEDCAPGWSDWYDEQYPDEENGGDEESYQKVIASGKVVCLPDSPVQNIECKAERFPNTPWQELGQTITCDKNKGLKCVNEDQGGLPCYNYKVRFCCSRASGPTAPSPSSRSPGPTASKDKTPAPPTSSNKEPEPSPPSPGPVTPKPPVEEKPTKPAPEESGAPPQEPTRSKDKTPAPPTSGNKEPEPSPSGGPVTPKPPVEEKPTKPPAPAESGAPPQEPTGPKDKTPPPPTSGNTEPEPSPSGGPVTPKPPVEEKPTKPPAPAESGAPPQEPTGPKDKTPPPPTSGNKEPEPSPSGGPVTPKPAGEEKPTKPAPEESGAPPQEPTGPKDKTPPPPTSSGKEPEPSPPTPGPEDCAPGWSDWYDEQYPDEENGGDEESYQKVIASGKVVCLPDSLVQNIECKAERFPNTPWQELGQTITCDKNKGLICVNEDQGGLPCYNYKVRFCCSRASGPPAPSPSSRSPEPTASKDKTPAPPTSGNKEPEPSPSGGPVTPKPPGEEKPTKPAPEESGAPPQEPTGPKDKTPPPPTSSGKEPEPSPPTPGPEDCAPGWSDWYDEQYPDEENGGDEESYQKVIASGKVVCLPDSLVQNIECKAERFPNTPWQELGQTITCDKNKGLICVNEDQGGLPCYNYKVRFCCSRASGPPAPSPSSRSPEPTASKDKTPAPPTSGNKEPEPSPSGGPVTPKPPGEEKPTKPAPEESGAPPQEPTGPKDKTPPPPTSSGKEPEPSPPTPGPEDCAPGWSDWYDEQYPDEENGGDEESYQKVIASGKVVCLPDSLVQNIECKAERFPNTPWQELGQTITCDKNKGLICVNEDQGGLPCYNYKVRFCCSRASGPPAPSPSSRSPEPTASKDKTPAPPTSGNKEPEPSPSGGPVTPKPPGEEKPTKPAPEESGAPPQEPTGPKDKTPPPPTSSGKEPEPSPPTPGPEDCAPGWSDWYDEQYPDEENGGDEESYQKVIASGKVVCLPDSPVQNIECKAERFPNTPWQELGQTITCDKNKGLKCVNEDQGGLPCYNYKVRFCCSRASGPPAPSPSSRSPEPTASKDKTPAPPTSSNKGPEPSPPSPGPVTPKPPIEEKPTKPAPEESGAPPQESTAPKDKTPLPPTSGNKEPEPSPSGGPVTPKPPGEENPTKPAPEESGAPPQEPTGPKDKTPPPPTSSGKEPEPSPPTPGPEDCAPGWSDWYDEQYPDEENGGDEESYQKVIASGKVVCLPDSPVQNIECKAERFPNTPWQELGQTITCDKNKGLKCVNEDQGGLPCYNYKVRFCCSRASGPPAPSPSSRSPEPTASKDKTPAPPTSGNKEPEPSPSGGPVTPKPPGEEKPTKPAPEESGAPPQEPTGPKDKTPPPPTSSSNEPEPSPPTSGPEDCAPGWSDWYDEQYPDEENGGDEESYQKVIASGKVVCLPDSPVQNIECKAERFPNTPWQELGQTITCDKNKGLKCVNEDQAGLPCYNYKVRFCCSRASGPPAPSPSSRSPEPTASKDKPPAPPTSGNKEPEPSPSGGPVTPKPPGEEKPTKPAPEESGAPPQEPTGPKDKTPPPPTSSSNEPEPSPPTSGPEDCAPGWSDWYDEQYPDEENGGDEESYQKVIASGKVVCLPDSPVQNIECKAERFPNTPWQELGQTITCDKNKGLKCVNEDQGGLPCYNYKVRFCCSRASGPPAPSPSSQSPEPTASKDKTPAPPTSSNKEPEPSPPSPGPVTPKPPVEEKPTKPAPEESGAPPQEPTAPKDKTPPPPTSGIKEPEPSPSGGPVTPKPPGEEKPTKPAPEESGAPPQEPTGPKDKTPPPPTSSGKEPEPSPPTPGPEDCAPGWSDWYDEQYPDEENGGDEESYQKVIASGKVVCLPDSPVQNIECKAERFPNTPWQELGQTITCDKNKGLKCVNEDQGGLPCYNYKVRFCCSRASGPPAPSPSSRSPEPTASKDKTPAPPTSSNKGPEPSPPEGPVTPKPPVEEKPTKPAPEESGAPPQEPTGAKDKTPPPPTSSNKEPEPSLPTPGPEDCTPGWSDWYDEQYPDEENGGDEESYQKVIASGKVVCLPDSPVQNIECKAERFPNTPWQELGQTITCDKNKGLKYVNEDQGGLPCYNYKVRFCCSRAGGPPAPSPSSRSPEPTASKDKTPAPPTSSNKGPEPSPPSPGPEDCTPGWSDWYDEQYPDEENGGDEESYQKVIASGKVVCLPDSPVQNIECKAERFPNTPWQELGQTITCDKNKGLKCVNEDQGGLPCYNYKVRFCCSRAGGPPAPSPSSRSQEPTASKDKTPPPPTTGNKEPEPSPPEGPVTPKPPVEEKPTKPAPEESGAPPQEPTGPKDKTPPSPTSSNKEPEPSPPTPGPEDCTPGWSDWYDEQYPDEENGGDEESYQKVIASGKVVCLPDSPVQNIECKAERFPNTPWQELGQTITCDKNKGLKCVNEDQGGLPCYNYKVRFCCSRAGGPPAPSPSSRSQEPTASKDKTPAPPTSSNKGPEPSPPEGPVTPKPPVEEKPTKPAPEESGAPPQEPTGPKDKTPPPPTSGNKEPEPSPPEGPVTPKPPFEEKPTKPAPEESGAPPPEPTASKDKTPAPPTSSNKGPEPSPPSPGPEWIVPATQQPIEATKPNETPTKQEDCALGWSEWYDDQYPDEENGGDEESYQKIIDSGREVCLPDSSVEKIDCKAERFPNTPWQELGQTITCDQSTGLKCFNNDQDYLPCYNYKIRFCCSRAGGPPAPTPSKASPVTPKPPVEEKPTKAAPEESGPPPPEPTASKEKSPPTSSNKEPEPSPSEGPVTPKPPVEEKPTKPAPVESGPPPQEPTAPKDKTPPPPTSSNKEPEPTPPEGPVTPKPPVEEKPTKPAPEESGAPPPEPTGSKDKTPPPPTSSSKEPEPSPPTPGPEDCTPGWSDWYDEQYPDEENGGDEESYQKVIASGKVVCLPDSPVQNIECKAERFPNTPWQELGQTITCDKNKGLKCVNEDQGGLPCYNYKVRFCCSTAVGPPAPTPSKASPEPTASKDKTPAPPTSGIKEPGYSNPEGPVTPKPLVEEKPTKAAPEESGPPPPEPTPSKEKSPPPPTSSNKEPELSPAEGPVTPKPPVEEKPTKPAPDKSGPPPQEPTAPKDKTPPSPTSGINEPEPSPPEGPVTPEPPVEEKPTKPAPEESGAPPQEPTAPKDKTPPPPTSSNKEPEPSPQTPGPVTPKPPVEEKPTKPAPEESAAPPQEPTAPKDKTPPPPTSSNKEPEPTPPEGQVTPKPPVEEKPTKPAPEKSGAPPQEPTGPKDKTPPPPTSGNKEPEPSPSEGPVTPKPPVEEEPTKPAPEESGAPPAEPTGSKDKTPPPPTSGINEPEPSPSTPGPEEDCTPGWSDWYDEQYPDEENGGDEESYQKVIASGKVVCLPDSPVQNIECKAERFPNTPWQELGQTITCDKNKGLKCVNEDQGGLPCYNYKVRFCCSRAGGPPAPTPSKASPEPTASKDKTPAPPTSGIKEPGPSNPEGPVTPKPPVEERPTKPVPEESGAPPPEPTGSKDKTPPPPTSSSKEPEPSPPTPGPEEDCATGWSDWYDDQYPDEDNGGDDESYEKVIASGKVVCLPDSSVEKIDCKAERFPNTPWQELGQTITCDKSTGLKCSNDDQSMFICYNYKVRFCCSKSGGPPPPPITQAPTKWAPEKPPTAAAPETTKRKPKSPPVPKETITIGEELIVPATQQPIEATKPNETPTNQEDCALGWSDWYDDQYPDEENGGDEESYQKIIDSGREVCLPDSSVEKIDCKAERFPNTPWEELGQTITCDQSTGLKCFNNDQDFLPCYNYKIRFCCSRAGGPPAPTPSKASPEPTASKDKTPAPPTSGIKEPGPSNPEGPVTPKPPVEEKPTKAAPEESGPPPPEPTPSKEKSPPPPTSSNKEPEPSPAEGPVTPKPPVEEKPTKPAPEESGPPPQEPTRSKDKTPPPPTSVNKEPEPSPPTPGPEDCAPGWSDWYDEQYPDEENGGDEESYQKVIASGKVVCLPDSPVQNIECKAERFPNTPWQELGQTITCDKNKGLKCVNEDQGGLPCYNYKVRFCCSRAGGPPPPPITQAPTKAAPEKPSTEAFSETKKSKSESPPAREETTAAAGRSVPVTQETEQAPRPSVKQTPKVTSLQAVEEKSTERSNVVKSSAAPSQNTPDVSTKAPQTSSTEAISTTAEDDEEHCGTGWSKWFDEHTPTEANGGDVETYQMAIETGEVVCPVNSSVEKIDCRADKFPHTNWKKLWQKITCDKETGLRCANENQGILMCFNYMVRFCCSEVVSPLPITTNAPSRKATKHPPKTVGPWTTLMEPEKSTIPSLTTAVAEEDCATGWSDWYDDQYPDNENGGDDESYEKVIASGKVVCLPDSSVEKIDCKAERFPHTPWQELGQTLTCDKNKGLKCVNEDQGGLPCYNYKVRFCCSKSGGPPPPPITQAPNKGAPEKPPTAAAHETTKHKPKKTPAAEVTSKPPVEEKPTKPAHEESGAPPPEPTGSKDKTPPPPTSSSKKPEPSTPTPGPEEDCATGWSDWYDDQYPDNENGGDDESYEKVIASGKVVCLPDSSVEKIDCKAERFPHTPWQELGQTITCDKNKGLKCVNEDQGGLPCYNYKVRFCCSKSGGPPPPPMTQAPTKGAPEKPPTAAAHETTKHKPKKTPAAEVTSKPPVEEKPTKPAHEESGAPPPEPTGSKDKTPPPPTSSSKEPEPSTPTPRPEEDCATGWSDWYDDQYPDNENGGDDESYEKVIASGKVVCLPDSSVEKIDCKAERFPHTPWQELGQTITCDKNKGLKCVNEDQGGLPCYNYKVRFCCSKSGGPPPPPITQAPTKGAPEKPPTAAAHETTKHKPKKTPAAEEAIVPVTHQQIEGQKPTTVAPKKRSTAAAPKTTKHKPQKTPAAEVKPTKSKTTSTTMSTTKKPEQLESYNVQFTIINRQFDQDLYNPEKPLYIEYSRNITTEITKLFQKEQRARYLYRDYSVSSFRIGSITVEGKCYFLKNGGENVPTLMKEFTKGTTNMTYLGPYKLRPDSLKVYVDKEELYYTNMNTSSSPNRSLSYWVYFIIALCCLILLALIIAYIVLALVRYFKNRGDAYKVLKIPWGIYYPHLDLRKSF
uniref:Mucin-19-like isoform X31 n=1 Tax=Petromyzon marinus TaxID=7757 RepID=A0AAJ7UIX0_PETMA|nr:mucin-19-like isoform X31 [Petromyzon marinus]